MTMYYKPAEPGVMLETGFGQEFLVLQSASACVHCSHCSVRPYS